MTSRSQSKGSVRLLTRVFAKSFRTQKLIFLMLFLSLFAGTTGLSAVMGLAQLDLEAKDDHLLADISKFYQILPTGSEITLREYQYLKANVTTPMVGYQSSKLADFPDINLLVLDTFALIEWRRFHNYIEVKSPMANDTRPINNSNQGEAQSAPMYFASGVTAQRITEVFPVTIISSLPDNLVVTDIASMATQAHQPLVFSGILLTQELPDFTQWHIRKIISDNFKLVAPVALDSDNQLQSSFRLNLLAMGALMFVVCLFIVFNAYQLMLMKRKDTIGVLKQLGFSYASVVFVLGLEALLLAVFTATVGTFAGFSILLAVLPAIEALTGVSSAPSITTFWALMAQTQSASIVGVIGALFVSLKWQKHMSVNLQHRPPNVQLLLFGVAAIGCLASVYMLLSVDSLHWSIPSTGLFVFASCLLVIAVFPLVLFGIKCLLTSKSPLIKLSVSSAWQLSKHTKVAVCAFFIAVICNIGMNVMVDSFRSATESWLKVRLIADAYLYTQSEEDIRPLIRNIDEQIKVVPRLGYEQQIEGKQTTIYSHPSTPEYVQAMVFEKVTDGVWDAFSGRQAVLINQQLAQHLQVNVGDTINVPMPKDDATDDELVTLPIAGIYVDYGNPSGQILLDFDWMSEFAKTTYLYALSFPSSDNIENRIEVLNQYLEDTAIVYETQYIIESSMKAFDATFIITDVMKLVTLAVAAMSLACSIVILLNESKAQDAILRSLGFSKRFVAARQALEYYFLCTFAFLAAVPFGLFLAWILIHIINRQAFGWSYAMSINSYPLLQVYLYSLVIVGGLISFALFRLSKRDIIDTGKTELKTHRTGAGL